MESLVLLVLPLCVLAVFAAFLLAFVDVAFGSAPQTRAIDAMTWRPPLARGNELSAWAARTAEAVVDGELRAGRRNLASRLAAAIGAGTNWALDQSPLATRQTAPQCASCRHRLLGVTPPEALAIADVLYRSRSRHAVLQIRQRAARNAQAATACDGASNERANLVCPLFEGRDQCAAFVARPLACRSWRRSTSGPAPEDTSIALGQGVTLGMSRGLQAAGLDGRVYELNSALAAVLETPRAAERWAAAEPIFAACQPLEPTTVR